MTKRKIEVKIEATAPEVPIRRSRRLNSLCEIKVENVKPEKINVRISRKNKTLSNKTELEKSSTPIRSVSKKENISPIKPDTRVPAKSSKIKKEKKGKTESVEIPIDRECNSKLGSANVFVEGQDIYDVMLNQTNLQFNNNKFYIIQLLQDNDKLSYSVWMRWARIGKIGQMKLASFGKNLDGAKKCFMQKFYDKTRNDWTERSDFEKVDGKYDLVHIDYLKKENPGQEQHKKEKVKLETLDCKLEAKIQDLLRIIFDIKEMNSAVSDLNYDTDRLPLGRLTESQIKAGYKSLREIEGLLNEGYSSNNKLIAACNAYYTRIPHDFGMRVPPVIRSLADIKQELELLETLSDIKITLRLLEMGDINVHPLDRQYKSLDSDIRPMSSTDELYQSLNDYLLTTHGNTHKEYSLEMLELYEIKKQKEWDNYEDVGNKMLLWHGSRTTNYGGILSQGLRIAPQEAPVTGHMFGKGVYFSDMSSKSANYIYPSRTKNVGFLLLCEVSLGKCNELIRADSKAAKLPNSANSVKGCGMIEPDSTSWITTSDGVVIPAGAPMDTGLSAKHKGYLLNYNEYIVYNRNQIRMRYMMKVRFNYKRG